MDLLILLCLLPVTQSFKHSLTYLFTTSTGLQTFPEFLVVAMIDGVEVGNCDSNKRKVELLADRFRTSFSADPEFELNTDRCREIYIGSKALMENFNWLTNQSKDVHVLQQIVRCELDDDTEETKLSNRYGFDGEDFIHWDVEAESWVYSQKAAALKNLTGAALFSHDSESCFKFLKKYLEHGNSSLERKVPPSVSLLLQSPSSPVSCHATGFYPDRAQMFWRKDGEKIHEDVDQGEILPNQDGTFQMRVDLNISPDEDWSRYECVFQLSGVDDIIIKLNQTVIGTNWFNTTLNCGPSVTQNQEVSPEKPNNTTIPIISSVVVVVGVVVAAAAVAGFMLHRSRAPGSELFEELNP